MIFLQILNCNIKFKEINIKLELPILHQPRPQGRRLVRETVKQDLDGPVSATGIARILELLTQLFIFDFFPPPIEMSGAELLDGGEVPDDVVLRLVPPRPQDHEAVALRKFSLGGPQCNTFLV